MAALKQKIYHHVRHLMWRVRSSFSPNSIGTFVLPDTTERIRCPLGTAIGCGLFIGNFEAAELSFLRQSLKPGDIFLDVGANVGVFSVVGARKVGPSGQVHAFEPGERELKFLRENIALNGLQNVVVHDVAVSSESGTADFFVSRDGGMSSLQKTNHPGQIIQKQESVRTTTLDEFCDRFHITRIDFIKIDVEGAEKLVFDGGRKLFSSGHSITILFESSDLNAPGFNYSTREFLSELKDRGFSLFRLNEDGSLSVITEMEDSFGKQVYNFVAKIK